MRTTHRSAAAQGRRRQGIVAVALAGALTLTVGGIALADNPASGTTTTGQGFEVNITASDSGPVAPGDTVTIDATATLGAASTSPVNYVYVVDVSGSLENFSLNPPQDIVPPAGIGPEDDCDGDGLFGTALDATCFGLLSLNESLGGAANVSVGLVAYGEGAVTADVDPAAGEQPLTSPPNANKAGAAVSDMEQVIGSLETSYGSPSRGGVGLFTSKVSDGFAGGTNFNAGLRNMNEIFAGVPEEQNIAAFISDGTSSDFSSGAGSPLAEAVAAGTLINTFRIGGGSAGACSGNQPLAVIAAQTGGVCTEVEDPSSLSAVFSDVLATQITSLEVSVGETVIDSINASELSSMGLSGIDITNALALGSNTVTVTATAADGTVVTATLTIQVQEETAPTETPTAPSTPTETPTPTATPTAAPSPTVAPTTAPPVRPWPPKSGF